MNVLQRLRNHRTHLGLTQHETAKSIYKLVGKKISQTLVSRFETNQLHPKNTLNLMPEMEEWIRKTRLESDRSVHELIKRIQHYLDTKFTLLILSNRSRQLSVISSAPLTVLICRIS